MAFKAINDTAGPNGLILTLLVYGAYPRLSLNNSPSPSITKRRATIQATIVELRKLQVERKLADTLYMRNSLLTLATLNLLLQSDVRIYRKDKAYLNNNIEMIFLTYKEKADLELAIKLHSQGVIIAKGALFEESQLQKL
ncbi:unnamed protein product [Diplocarpon coronariae]